MEEIGTFIVNNSLGVASFCVLIYFIKEYLSKLNDNINAISKTNVEVSKTLISVKDTLEILMNRVEVMEKIVNKKGGNNNDISLQSGKKSKS